MQFFDARKFVQRLETWEFSVDLDEEFSKLTPEQLRQVVAIMEETRARDEEPVAMQ